MNKTILSVLLAGLLSTSSPAAETAPSVVGWRGDGYSGVMPPDCKPPKDFNGVTGKNLRWKAPLPNHGNSAPLPVGNKIFVTCDGGWPVGQDCPQLVCFDADTGKELWRRDLDHFDNLPEAEAKAAKADRAEAWKQTHEYCALFWELRHGNPDAARQTTIIERFKKAGFEVREPALEWFRDKLGGNSGILCDKALSSRLEKVGFAAPTWGWRCMGVVMPTPASDGKAVYVATGFRTMSAFDLDGKKLWQVIANTGKNDTHQFAHSPFLVDGVLLMNFSGHLWCYEPASGRVLWSTSTDPKCYWGHGMGQPTVLRLEAAGKAVTCIFTTYGQLIRLSDGKILLEKLAMFATCATMSGNGTDVVWGKNGVEGPKQTAGRTYADDKGMIAIRFRLDASGQTATSEQVIIPFSDTEMGWSHYPIFHQGRIVCQNGEIIAFDGKTSKLLRPCTRHFIIGSNGFFLADGRLYGFFDTKDKDKMQKTNSINCVRTCIVRWIWTQDERSLAFYDNPIEALPAPLDMSAEQQRKIMAQVGYAAMGGHSGIYDWHNDYKAPAAAGDRLYVRTFDNLYCFAPEVNGTLKDDPAKVLAIRKETKADALLPNLTSASAQERFEAVRRLGNLKQVLSPAATETVAKLLASDTHDEIRLAVMQTLEICDPTGKAAWTVLTTKVFPEAYGSSIPDFERRGEQQKVLARMFDGLDPQGVAGLLKHWPEAETDPGQRLALLDLATRLAWKDAVMLKSALIAAQDPKRWGHHPSMHILPQYFTIVQAAADPTVAEILVKVYAQNLSMESSFRRNGIDLISNNFTGFLHTDAAAFAGSIVPVFASASIG